MAASPEMRASDGDRDRVAELLREHCAQGRLTIDEFHERLDTLQTCRTYGDLAKLTADLPEIDLHSLPAQVGAERSRSRANAKATGIKAAWAAWAAVAAINWVIWLIVVITGFHWVYPWPLWVMGPWGAVLLVATIFSGGWNGGGERR